MTRGAWAFVAMASWACGAPEAPPWEVRPEAIRRQLGVLAADSMEGRRAGSAGAAKAARFLAAQLGAAGVAPAGDSGFFQRVPLARDEERPERLRLLPSFEELAALPRERRAVDVNVIGVLRGADPDAGGEAVIVGAHYDHVGIGRPVEGDSIYNGADDDASGVVAVLEIARALAARREPLRRSVVFLLTTGEEMGMLGTRWYADHPVIPLERTVADLQIEMIGRPDSQAGGPGRAWLTGFDRSTMGAMLQAAGVPVVADPRPDQNFFLRSDNVVFAYRGIPAHTLSSFGMHRDYHRPSDEIEGIDVEHASRTVQAAIDAVLVLADGERPAWHPGGRPEPPTERAPAR